LYRAVFPALGDGDSSLFPSSEEDLSSEEEESEDESLLLRILDLRPDFCLDFPD
jgi:hypothetical protein